jgi:hypothetical protein
LLSAVVTPVGPFASLRKGWTHSRLWEAVKFAALNGRSTADRPQITRILMKRMLDRLAVKT